MDFIWVTMTGMMARMFSPTWAVATTSWASFNRLASPAWAAIGASPPIAMLEATTSARAEIRRMFRSPRFGAQAERRHPADATPAG